MKIQLPVVLRDRLLNVAVARLKAEARLEGVKVERIGASGLRAGNMSVDEAFFEKVLFASAKLEKLRAADVEFRACDFSATTCAEGTFIRTCFNNCRLMGANLSQVVFKDVVFQNCKLDMSNFRLATLKRVQFIDCVLSETDFQMSELTDVEFQNCRLEKTEFDHCKIKRADARTSQMFDIRGWQSLRGLTIDTSQLMAVAPELATELGLTIKD